MYFRSYLRAPPYFFHLPVRAIVVRRSEWRSGSLTPAPLLVSVGIRHVKTKTKRVHRWGHYWFDSMEEDESLPAIDAAFFDAIEGPDCVVPEPVTKQVCKSCKRNLSEAEHFIPGRKTCHECLKKHRNQMRKKRRKERSVEISNIDNNSNKKQQTSWTNNTPGCGGI